MFHPSNSIKMIFFAALILGLVSIAFALPAAAEEPVTYYALGYQIVCLTASGNTTNDDSLATTIAVLHPDFVDPILAALFADVDTSGGNQLLDEAPGVYGGVLSLYALAGGGFQLNGVDNTGKLDDYEFSGCNPLMDVSPASPDDDDNKECNQMTDRHPDYRENREVCLSGNELCTTGSITYLGTTEYLRFCEPVVDDPSECPEGSVAVPIGVWQGFEDEEGYFCSFA